MTNWANMKYAKNEWYSVEMVLYKIKFGDWKLELNN